MMAKLGKYSTGLKATKLPLKDTGSNSGYDHKSSLDMGLKVTMSPRGTATGKPVPIRSGSTKNPGNR